MSNSPYPPPENGGFPPPEGWPGSYNSPGSGFPPPGSGFPPPPGAEGYNPVPPMGGYSQPGGYPPPGGYSQPGGYGQPGGYSQPGGYPPAGSYGQPGGYPPPGSYQPPSMYGSYQQPLYAPPPPNLIGGLPLASFGSRVVALVLDGVLAGIAWVIVSRMLHLGSGFWGWAIFYAIYAVVTSLYLTGATPGKKALGLKVTNEQGNLPDRGSLILRYSIGYWVSSFIAGIGFLLAASDSRKQALHDKIAKTYVVQKQSPGYYPPPPPRY